MTSFARNNKSMLRIQKKSLTFYGRIRSSEIDRRAIFLIGMVYPLTHSQAGGTSSPHGSPRPYPLSSHSTQILYETGRLWRILLYIYSWFAGRERSYYRPRSRPPPPAVISSRPASDAPPRTLSSFAEKTRRRGESESVAHTNTFPPRHAPPRLPDRISVARMMLLDFRLRPPDGPSHDETYSAPMGAAARRSGRFSSLVFLTALVRTTPDRSSPPWRLLIIIS